MSTEFQVTGGNSKAPFTLKVHRGDGMALLAMNWRQGKPPRNFVGFAIEFREPESNEFWAIKNRVGFPGQRTKFSDPPIDSTMAPFQYFRWVHFPKDANLPGKFTYRVTPMFMDGSGALGRGESQMAAIALMRETHPGQINIGFTRGHRPSSRVFSLTGLLIPWYQETQRRDSSSSPPTSGLKKPTSGWVSKRGR